MCKTLSTCVQPGIFESDTASRPQAQAEKGLPDAYERLILDALNGDSSLFVRDDEVHPGVELRANLKSISHKCHLFEVAFVSELTTVTIHLPLSCLQGGKHLLNVLRTFTKSKKNQDFCLNAKAGIWP